MMYYYISQVLFALCLALAYALIRQRARCRKFIVKIRKDIAYLKEKQNSDCSSAEYSEFTLQKIKDIDDALLIAIKYSKKENGGPGDEDRFIELHKVMRKSLP